jgi:hypothetical protein
MQNTLKDMNRRALVQQRKNVVNTTLYELIETISEEVEPEEKKLIPEIVADLLNTCRSNCWVQ